MSKLRTFASFLFPIATFAGAVQTITGNTGGNNTNKGDIYTQALNFETGKNVLEGRATANPTQFQMFNIDLYLYSIAKLRKVYGGTKEISAKKWQVKTLAVNGATKNQVIQKSIASSPLPSETKRVMGFCEFDRDIVVYGKEKIYVNIPCYLEGINGVATLFGILEPNLSNYSLILKPLELYTDEGIYKIKAGYVLNAERSNPNVATEIDTKAIEKILARTGVDVGNTVKDITKEIAQGKTTTVQVTGDVTVKQNNYSFSILPTAAFWTGVASLVSNIASYFEKQTANIPITFKVAKGAEVFLNAIIEPEKYQMQTTEQKNPKPSEAKPKAIKTIY